jgi:hypothetical protein
MKKVLLFATLLAIIAGGCKKSTAPAPIEMTLPWNSGIVPMQLSSSNIDGIPISGVSGIFVACNIVGSMQDITGNHNTFSRSWQRAMLTEEASSVSVNSVELAADGLISPLKANFAGYNEYLWNMLDSNTWTVTANKGPLFTTSISGAMPVLRSSLLSSIPTKTAIKDLNYGFNVGSNRNADNADSAYIVIYDGNSMVRSSVADARGGIATISKSQLASLLPNNDRSTTLDGKTYKGALIACVLYNYSVKSIGGKDYAFVKQRVTLSFARLW